MKKNILKATVVAFVTLVIGLNFMQDKNATSPSDLALSNIEALAGDETDPHVQGPPLTNWKPYTVTCTEEVEICGNFTFPVGQKPVGVSGCYKSTKTYQGSKCGYGSGSCWSSSC